jgi:c-di-GMP-binding flagellar brake protein YcgR
LSRFSNSITIIKIISLDRGAILSADRRRHERRIIRVTVKVTIEDNSVISAQSLDISISGMCLVSTKRIALHNQCKLTFGLVMNGKMENFSLNAQIMHSTFCGDDGFKIGIQFINLETKSTELLNKFLQ